MITKISLQSWQLGQKKFYSRMKLLVWKWFQKWFSQSSFIPLFFSILLGSERTNSYWGQQNTPYCCRCCCWGSNKILLWLHCKIVKYIRIAVPLFRCIKFTLKKRLSVKKKKEKSDISFIFSQKKFLFFACFVFGKDKYFFFLFVSWLFTRICNMKNVDNINYFKRKKKGYVL